jgi:hypothetical protein
MTSLSPDTWKRIQDEAPRFLHMPTRQMVDIVLLFLERDVIPAHVITRTLDPLRAELRRREVAGWDDPFHPVWDSVTQS